MFGFPGAVGRNGLGGASGASTLMGLFGNPSDGLFIDLTDNSLIVKDSSTAANNYAGTALSKLTFTRASTATRFNASGLIESVASDVARIDYNPSPLALRGLLIEGARTNLVLNSDTLSTQSVTVTAAVHTLSFYGTGTITLSGASTAGPLTGSGAFPTRSSLVFTPSAGSLTLTVTGTVQYAQLELGAIPSSYIPTAGATVTRAAEVCKIATTLFPATVTGPYTIFAKAIWPTTNASDVNRVIYGLNNGTALENRYFIRLSGGTAGPGNTAGGSDNFSHTAATATPFATFKIATRYSLNNSNYAFNGSVLGADDTVCAVPLAPTQLNMGNLGDANSNHWSGWIQQIAIVPIAFTNSQLQAVTA